MHLVTFVIVLAFLVTACGSAGGTATGTATGTSASNSGQGKGYSAIKGDTLWLGAALSETGAFAKEGKLTKDGYDFWAKWVNSKGGIKLNGKSYKVAIKYYDDESKADVAAKLVDRLVNQDGIKLLLGPYGSPSTFAASTVSEKNGALMIAAESSAEGVFTRGYKHLFGLMPFAADYMDGGLSLIQKKGLKKVAVIWADDNFSADGGKGVVAKAKKLGLDVVFSSSFPSGTNDLTTLLSQVKATQPEALLEFGHASESILLVKTMKQLGLNVKLVEATVGPPIPDFAKALGKDAEYVLGESWWNPGQSGTDPIFGDNATWVKAFEQDPAFGYQPDYHVSDAVAAAEIVQLAVEKTGSTDPDVLAKAISGMNFKLQHGSFRFDAANNHEVGLTVGAIQVQNGKPVPVWPEEFYKNFQFPMPAWGSR